MDFDRVKKIRDAYWFFRNKSTHIIRDEAAIEMARRYKIETGTKSENGFDHLDEMMSPCPDLLLK